jgi:cysteinyl-tRNA synthetase
MWATRPSAIAPRKAACGLHGDVKTAFFEDLETLRIKRAAIFKPPPNLPPRADIAMIGDLVARHRLPGRGSACKLRLRSFPTTESWRTPNLEELRPSGRIANDDAKESIGDFALWKAWDGSMVT